MKGVVERHLAREARKRKQKEMRFDQMHQKGPSSSQLARMQASHM
jgi:hypothetical protein